MKVEKHINGDDYQKLHGGEHEKYEKEGVSRLGHKMNHFCRKIFKMLIF